MWYLLEKVVFAEELAVSGEAFVAELDAAVAALKAFGVPRSFRNL